MGVEKGKDNFTMLMRVTLWENSKMGEEYLNNLDKEWCVFRITPKKQIEVNNPWPIPKLKVRETCKTEFNILPTAKEDLNYLREKIIQKYGSDEYEVIDLKTTLWAMESYEGFIQDENILGESRDVLFLKTNTFQLTSDDDFLILYGVNHTKKGKAIYSNASFYGAEKLNGVSVIYSPNCCGTAAEYFPKNSDKSENYYVYKMARKECGDCMVVITYSKGNKNGYCYGVDNYQDTLIGFRIYLDQKTLIVPAPYDII